MILVCDGEMSDLSADMGELLIFGFTWIDPYNPDKKFPIQTFNIVDTPEFKKDMLDDSGLLKKAAKIFEKADMVVTHYGRKHDIPFINTRLLYHHLPPLAKVPHVDTWAIAKYQLRFQSNRQANITEYLTAPEKQSVPKKEWRLTRAGCKKTIKKLNSRCASDVDGLREMYLRLRPFMATHPDLGRLTGEIRCPACNSKEWHSKGKQVANRVVRVRRVCLECGHNWYIPISQANKT